MRPSGYVLNQQCHEHWWWQSRKREWPLAEGPLIMDATSKLKETTAFLPPYSHSQFSHSRSLPDSSSMLLKDTALEPKLSRRSSTELRPAVVARLIKRCRRLSECASVFRLS